MIRLLSHRWLPLLRVVVLGMFALGLVLQPVMAAAGEMHEFAHDPAGSHAHAPDAVDADAAATGAQDVGEDRTLHVLLQFAHCCGTTPALLQVFKPILAKTANGRLAIVKTPMPPQVRLASPFKPPIAA
ncbi:hypothetical protein [Lysobacter sp. F6437]|uniref:hypothetical protein n=1 Tax=Lysobacter sp. F6437 TaxID=3459296 RepID=UPI00403DC8B1